MVTKDEMILFIEEIYMLIKEYKRCTDEQMKKQIYRDILQLSEVISEEV
ncbi:MULTISPECIES: hypothetical protein [Metabacillus]|nr:MULTISPECIES: hypothetical protein [Metabacillus]MCM3443283.1 hypothetical protein [Metabacillus halosaccharovorans]